MPIVIDADVGGAFAAVLHDEDKRLGAGLMAQLTVGVQMARSAVGVVTVAYQHNAFPECPADGSCFDYLAERQMFAMASIRTRASRNWRWQLTLAYAAEKPITGSTGLHTTACSA